MNRVKGGVFSNKSAEPLGLYKPEEALRLVDEAIDMDAYPGDLPGNEYYDIQLNGSLVGSVFVSGFVDCTVQGDQSIDQKRVIVQVGIKAGLVGGERPFQSPID